jgi:F420-dependent oxidoreductase-like protein
VRPLEGEEQVAGSPRDECGHLELGELGSYSVQRAREHVDICRKLWRREPSDYQGRCYTLPLKKGDGGTGLGKALKLISHPVRERIPMLLAAIGPKNVELAAEIFDEWQPILFHPGHVESAFGEALSAGDAKRDPSLGPLGIVVHVNALITDDESAQRAALRSVRDYAALYVGGMGARGRNFYNTLVVRYGYVEEATAIQDLYLQGKKAEAAAVVPDDLARAISLIGPPDEVKTRLAALRAVGVTCVMANSVASTRSLPRFPGQWLCGIECAVATGGIASRGVDVVGDS